MRNNSRVSKDYAFECSEYFHLAELTRTAILIYGLAFKISKRGERPFFASAVTVGEYLNISSSQIRRGLEQLEELGLLELKESGKFRANIYRVIQHKDWAKSNPGKCCSKEEFPWIGEGDPLGIELWTITGGIVRFKEFQIQAFRKLGLSDATIIAEFQRFWGQSAEKIKARMVSPSFYKWLETIVHGEH
jgi:hypothetical protein